MRQQLESLILKKLSITLVSGKHCPFCVTSSRVKDEGASKTKELSDTKRQESVKNERPKDTLFVTWVHADN
jgi:hypothetical protein